MRAHPLCRTAWPGVLLVLLLACSSTYQPRPSGAPSYAEPPHGSPGSTASSTPSSTPTPAPTGAPGEAPPPWLGRRVLRRTASGFGEVGTTPPELERRRFTLPDELPQLPGPGFASRVTTPAPEEVIDRSSWDPECPVDATDLSWIRLSFWGFDQRRHTGELLTHRTVARELVAVFARLYRARFPIEEMRVTTRREVTAAPTGDGNDTGSFVCRVTVGASSYSQHAYGLAVDVNPFQNPYHKGELVLPELASSYLDRSWVRPGMITPSGPVVKAFAEIGWTWGGTWDSLTDLHHFSASGR